MIFKRIQILENQLFESLANARKLYSNKIEPETFDELVSIDISNTYKYIEKICKFYLQDPSIDFEELKNNIELFDKLSSKNIIDIKDINRFRTYDEFNDYMNSNSDKMSKSEEQKLLKNKGTETILNNENVLVLLIKDKEASIQYGANTKWCISATKSKNYFASYRGKKVTFYFIFQKNLDSSNPNYKIAVAVYSSGKLECYDAEDKRVKFSEIKLPKKLFKPVELTQDEKAKLLKSYIEGSYKINSRGLIDVNGDVRISNLNLKSILDIGRFGIVTGYFDCDNSHLTSLEGCPERIGKSFSCRINKLESLEFAPKYVGGSFYCYDNKDLTSLKGCPTYVGETFNCGFCALTSLEYAPTYVGEDFNCYFNKKKFTVEDVVEVCDVKGEIDV